LAAAENVSYVRAINLERDGKRSATPLSAHFEVESAYQKRRMVMKKRILIFIALVVSGLAFFLGRSSARTSLAEGAQGQAPVNCAIAKANGPLKSVTSFSGGGSWQSYLVFEDSTGMIRIMDERCNVAFKFARQ
jgi:hypothetical protein